MKSSLHGTAVLLTTPLLLVVAGSLVGCHSSAPEPPPPAAVAKATPDAGFQVWADASAGVYYYPGMDQFNKTAGGHLMTEPEARASGLRPFTGHK